MASDVGIVLPSTVPGANISQFGEYKDDKTWALTYFCACSTDNTVQAQDDYWMCRLCKEGKETRKGLHVKANIKHGASGLVSHLKQAHKEEWEKRNVKKRGREGDETQTVKNWLETLETSSSIASSGTKSSTPRSAPKWTDRQILHYIARNALAYSIADDSLMKDGVSHRNRHWAADEMVREGERLYKHFLSLLGKTFVSVSVDLGTTQRKRTADITVTVFGYAYPIDVIELQEGEGAAHILAEKLMPLISDLQSTAKAKVVSVTADNASNMKKMQRLLAERVPDLLCVSCGCHTIQLLVKDALFAKDDVILARAICDKARKYLRDKGGSRLVIPEESSTRWGYVLRVFDFVVAHRDECIAFGQMTLSDLSAVQRACSLLAPFERASRLLEQDSSNLLDAATVLATLLPFAESAGCTEEFQRRFLKHVHSDGIIAGAAFAATFIRWSVVSAPCLRMLRGALTRLCCENDRRMCDYEFQTLIEGNEQTAFRHSSFAPLFQDDAPLSPVPAFYRSNALTSFKVLHSLCQRLQAVAASEASVERMFSKAWSPSRELSTQICATAYLQKKSSHRSALQLFNISTRQSFHKGTRPAMTYQRKRGSSFSTSCTTCK
jgi:hypothetical protein